MDMTTKRKLIEPADLKMTREALCAAQSALLERRRQGVDVDRVPHWVERIGSIIRGIDERRPLGPDGKHGERHTPHCGCELEPCTAGALHGPHPHYGENCIDCPRCQAAAQHPIEAQPDGDTTRWGPPRYVPCGRHGCLLCAPGY